MLTLTAHAFTGRGWCRGAFASGEVGEERGSWFQLCDKHRHTLSVLLLELHPQVAEAFVILISMSSEQSFPGINSINSINSGSTNAQPCHALPHFQSMGKTPFPLLKTVMRQKEGLLVMARCAGTLRYDQKTSHQKEWHACGLSKVCHETVIAELLRQYPVSRSNESLFNIYSSYH